MAQNSATGSQQQKMDSLREQVEVVKNVSPPFPVSRRPPSANVAECGQPDGARRPTGEHRGTDGGPS